jgi:hypothetical protein
VRLDGVRHVLVERQDFDGVLEQSAPISTMLTSRELQIAYSLADGKCDQRSPTTSNRIASRIYPPGDASIEVPEVG